MKHQISTVAEPQLLRVIVVMPRRSALAFRTNRSMQLITYWLLAMHQSRHVHS